MPGVKAIFTGEDTADLKTPPPMVRYPGKGGSMIKVPHRDVLARKRVRYVGQEVALVVATSAAAAQDAAEAIEVEYRDLPAVVDARAALEPGAPQLHDEIPGNLSFDYVYGDEQATEAAFAGAAHVTRLTLDSTRVSGTPMEPKACVVAYDAQTESFDVYASTQGLAMMLPNLVAITGVPAEKIRIHAHDVGGGFGIRSQAYPEYCALMLAARKVGRPVKWVGSRFETIVSDHHGRAAQLDGELALDRDGPLPRPARALGGERRRVPLAARAAHQHAQSGDARDQRLPHPGALRPPPARAHQHHLDHRLPRRRPAERLLPGRAPGRRGGARDRHRPHRAAPPQLHSEGGVPVQDAGGLDLRQRRPGGRVRGSARKVRLGRLRVQKKGLDAKRKAARHRLRGVLRALRRRRRCRRRRR